MAKVSIILEDLEDGTLRLAMISDVPLKTPLSNAQLFAIAAHAVIADEMGAPLSEIAPVPVEGMPEWSGRCEAVHPRSPAVQCVLPIGHAGDHEHPFQYGGRYQWSSV